MIGEYGEKVETMKSELQKNRERENDIDSKSRELYKEKTQVSSTIDKIYETIRKNDDLISNKKTIIASLSTKIENILETVSEKISG